jgi:phosphoglycolate phosphatase-like HAD superfamily hydrolase
VTAGLSEIQDRQLTIREGFAWDEQAAYLFDVDGTLLRSRDRIHFNSFSASIRQVTGLDVPLEGVVLHGGTDTAILREAFALSGVAAETWEPHKEAILEAMRKIVKDRRDDLDIWMMPAVEETVRYLAGTGALLGLATGNLEEIGWTKVERIGLRKWFRFGGFSDRFEVRSELVADAAEQARALLGDPDALPCVVGDTPRDIQAARANGFPVIAVATGIYGFDEMAALEPDVCASSLAVLLAERGVELPEFFVETDVRV